MVIFSIGNIFEYFFFRDSQNVFISLNMEYGSNQWILNRSMLAGIDSGSFDLVLLFGFTKVKSLCIRTESWRTFTSSWDSLSTRERRECLL